MACVHLIPWSLQRFPEKSRLSRVPWLRSPRAPPIGASYTGASLRRSRSVPRPVVLDVQLLRSGKSAALRQVRAQINQYCNPLPGSPLWVLAMGTRSLLSCGRWFLPHWRCPQSAIGPWCLRLLRPIGT